MQPENVQMQRRKPPTIGVAIAGRLSGVGRSVAYDAARTGRLMEGVPVIKVGQRYRVPTAALEQALGIDVFDYLTDAELGLDDPAAATATNAPT
jgi:hypothetical protein